MQAQGFNVAVQKQSTDLFALTLPTKKKKSKKKKKKRFFSNNVASKQSNVVDVHSDDDVIVIESDNSRGVENVPDDDVMVINSPGSTIIISENEDEEPVSKRTKNVSIVPSTSSNVCDNNIVINIHQTLSIDHIMNGETNVANNCISSKEPQVDVNGNEKIDVNFEHLRTHGYPKRWTEDMIKFYTKPCEKSRTFDCIEILRKLKTKPSDWWINKADATGPQKRKRNRYSQYNQFGHTRQNCNEKINIVCYICGQHNHVYSHCPNTLCLTCGKPAKRNLKSCNYCEKFLTNKEPCNLCGQLYHNEVLCPSKWRKHLILNNSDQPMKLNPRKFCYNCAKPGHFGFECSLTSASEYPPENPFKSTFFNPNEDSGMDEIDQNQKRVIFLSEKNANLLASQDGNQFLKNFTNISNVRLEFFRGPRNYIRIIGAEIERHNFRDEFDKWKFVTKEAGTFDFR